MIRVYVCMCIKAGWICTTVKLLDPALVYLMSFQIHRSLFGKRLAACTREHACIQVCDGRQVKFPQKITQYVHDQRSE